MNESSEYEDNGEKEGMEGVENTNSTTNHTEDNNSSKKKSKWKRFECAHCKHAVMAFGFDRWEDVRMKAELKEDKFQVSEVEAFALAMVKKCLMYLEEDETKPFVSIMEYIWKRHK